MNNNPQQANYYNKLWSVQNLKSIIYAFCKGFADSLKFWDIFFLDSMEQNRQYDRLVEKNVKKERLLNRGDSPGPSENLAKKRALEKRSGKNAGSSKDQGEPKIMERTIKCCILNGCFFWFSIVVFENFLMPFLHWIVLCVLGQTAGTALWSSVVPVLSVTFATLWVLPFYLLSKVVNSIWFADIADTAFRKTSSGRPKMMTSFSVSVADTLFTIVVESIFLIQSKIFSMCIPISAISMLINVFHLCLLNALYSFEYKWYNQGLELHKRLSFIECHWPYFLGYGLPLALITSYPESVVVSGCVFSILFPLFLVSGNQGQVVATYQDVTLKIFNPTMSLSNMLLSRTLAPPMSS